MKATEAFDATIRKFQRLVKERLWGNDWNMRTCPLCIYHRKSFRGKNCYSCPLMRLGSCVCAVYELDIAHNTPEQLQMLGQIRIYLYGQKGLIRR